MKSVKVKFKTWNFIKYLMAVAGFVLLFMFNHRQALFICMVSILVLIIPSIVMAIKPSLCPKVTLSVKDSNGAIGESTQLITTIYNKSFIPFTRIHIYYDINHSLEKISRTYQNVYSSFIGTKEFKENIVYDFCGVYNISASKIIIYDWLKIISYEIVDLPATKAIIMPNSYDLSAVVNKLALKDEESIKDDPLAGIDVSEVKELRDYREGDRLSQVHWKLSTKSEDLIVKEYDKTAGTCIVLALDASYKDLTEINNYYGFFYSFALKLIESEMFFEVIYFDEKLEDIVSYRITNSYDLGIAIQNMFFSIKSVDLYELDAYYKQMNSRSKLMFITSLEPDPMIHTLVTTRENIKLLATI